MNDKAQQHLAKAKGYIAKGDEFYRRAKIEISVAIEQDPVLSQQDIATAIGMSKTWVADVIKWDGTGTLYGKDSDRRQIDMAKQVGRDPVRVDELIEEPEVRANLSKALDRHYQKRAETASTARREREIDRRGGSDSDEEYRFGLRVGEMVNAMRGVVSGLRFVSYEARNLDIAEADEEAASELHRLTSEAISFCDLLNGYLAGSSITDEDIAQLIGAADGTN